MVCEQDLISEGQRMLSKSRWEHSLRTADYAVFMADHYGLPHETVRLAALAHDLAREKPADIIVKWALLDQNTLSEYHLAHPVLLHGFASAWYLREHFALTDDSLLNAVRYHTTGHPDLDASGLIVFAADYMEPGRTHLTDLTRKNLLILSLEELVLAILDAMKLHLVSKGLDLSPDSRELSHRLKKRYNHGL
ncbi:HD domain-containing protein [Oceanispirochaeta crateris]|uniref:bis(5'-nucleosyl)-tetraphosphatase (symmetrical) n=2 Tax=Oceanispirochaeta crateris TaxID=2518645 RepID=A0A5C1QHZ9_9SPIO|nr:HD domain-containing protein [Oceanispirochaeta crateris]